MKTVKFYTLGCKVNQYDTQEMRERFLRTGLVELEDSHPADLYVINTCTVTQRADAESLNIIRRARRENPRAKIVVTGCLTELNEDKIKKADDAILIVKNRDKGSILEHFPSYDSRASELTGSGAISSISYFKGHTRAFIKIQDGCNNFCSYCKVPLVRGPSRSRKLNEIVREAENLTRNGFRELVLCGICVGLYGKDLSPQIEIADVIEALEAIDGVSRIRLSSIEAADVTEKLIEKISRSKKFCPHLHIPIQSGDNEILRKMNRRYSREDYLGLVKRIKNKIALVNITTDVLVGFPAEDENSFQNTVDLVNTAVFLKVHIFPYSRREATPASKNFRYAINPLIIKERAARLKACADITANLCKKQLLGKEMDILVEGPVKENLDFWQGYTGNYVKVIFEAKDDLQNHIIRLKLKEITQDGLLGVLC